MQEIALKQIPIEIATAPRLSLRQEEAYKGETMKILYHSLAIAVASFFLAGSALAAPVETVLYSFTGGRDGAGLLAGLIADNQGTLYGTTQYGGTASLGTVFKLTPPANGQSAWTETVLYSFTGGSDGGLPYAGLIADNQGALYGTTHGAVLNNSLGTVFKLTPPANGQSAWTETVLYSFCNHPQPPGCSDGFAPEAGLIADNQGALYGTTLGGTVFKLTPPAKGQTTWTETVLYSFTGGSDGGAPEAGLIADNQGALYGTTSSGGTGNAGTVFKLTPPAKGQTAWTPTVLYSFCSLSNCSDGYEPRAGLIADNQGALYGTTEFGGTAPLASSKGTVFKLTPPAKGQTAWTETVLYSFCSLSNCSDGANPVFAGVIADNQGALYGTTELGGTAGVGTGFKLTPPAKGQTAWTETVLHDFGSTGSDGGTPYAGLIANHGALYGTTSSGGTGAFGTVFQLTLR
jgi:uncharacterized repeat protein (TIGR03803 family)